MTTTGGGSTKTTKEETTLDPNLASASTHWLASRYTCCIHLLGIALYRLLQSDSKGSINRFGLSLDNIWTTLNASSSTIKLKSPKSFSSFLYFFVQSTSGIFVQIIFSLQSALSPTCGGLHFKLYSKEKLYSPTYTSI